MHFDRCWPWLEAAARRQGGIGRAELLALLQSNRAQLWPGEGGALVTELAVTPEGRCLHVWLGGGRLEALLAMRPGVEAWARAQGCTHATLGGRSGWARVFAPFGFAAAGDEIRKAL